MTGLFHETKTDISTGGLHISGTRFEEVLFQSSHNAQSFAEELHEPLLRALYVQICYNGDCSQSLESATESYGYPLPRSFPIFSIINLNVPRHLMPSLPVPRLSYPFVPRKDTFDLHKIPAELRNAIYGYCVVKPEPISISDKANLSQPEITRVCKQLREESLPIFFGQNTFEHVHPNGGSATVLRSLTCLKTWLDNVGTKNLSLIRKMTIVVQKYATEPWSDTLLVAMLQTHMSLPHESILFSIAGTTIELSFRILCKPFSFSSDPFMFCATGPRKDVRCFYRMRIAFDTLETLGKAWKHQPSTFENFFRTIILPDLQLKKMTKLFNQKTMPLDDRLKNQAKRIKHLEDLNAKLKRRSRP